jgi:SAM-dependent methyltransferase
MFSVIDKIAYAISARSRRKKLHQFIRFVAPQPHETLVDVGVNTEEYSATDNYLEKFYSFPENITAVGFGNFSLFRERYPKIITLEGDGRALPFSDNSFDIGYSNAVLEHVGSTPADQLQFLAELARVCKRGYLTTPNRHFPFEIHTRTPLLHLLLPKKMFDAFLVCIGKKWATGDYMHLLSEKDVHSLFANAHISNYTLIKNRFFYLPMTFTVVWHK